MPLSDHEQRLLDEIEQTLRTDDPVLASSLKSARSLPQTRTYLLITIVGLLAGCALLATALRLSGVASPLVGVLGFGFVVAATDCGLRAITRVRGDRSTRRGRR
jgi:uncharacterized membrane protein